MKKTTLLLLGLTMLLFIPLTVNAFELKTGNSVYVAEDETISGNLYVGANNVTIDGTVEGDVICGAQTVNINGYVAGSLRVAGNSISVNGEVAKNAQALGANIFFGKNSNVGWDLFTAGATGEFRGNVGRTLHGALANAVVAGTVGEDVKLRLDERTTKELDKFAKKNASLDVTKGAVVGGNVYYTAGRKGVVSEQAEIGGEVGHSFPKKKKGESTSEVWGYLFSVFSALVVGLVIISIWREQIKSITSQMLNKVGLSIGYGAAIMFLTPLIVILLMFTLIGIPLGLIVVVIWVIALYIAKIITSILVGRSILDKFWTAKKKSLIWAMIIGVLLTWLITSLPFIGWIFCLIAVWWGLGGLWTFFRKK